MEGDRKMPNPGKNCKAIRKKFWREIGFYIVVMVITLIILLPVIIFVLISLKPTELQLELPPRWLFTPTISNYVNAFREAPLVNGLINSLVVSLPTAVLTVLITFLAAYSVARFRTGGNTFPFWLMSIQMLPPIIFVIPLYSLIRNFGLIDTVPGLILVYFTLCAPFAFWVLRSFIEEIPKDIEEAAMLDGCSTLSVMVRITLPLTTPGLVTAFILSFITCWNEFPYALVLTISRSVTMPVAIARLITAHGPGIRWGMLAAGGIIGALPPLVLSLVIRKYLIRGLTFGLIKEQK